MRIIAGSKRGMRLVAPPDERIRPTTDRVKEALFGSLQFEIAGANVLDLFAGSGALGLEAASRGAKEAVLVDNDATAMKIIEENIKRMGLPTNVKLVKNDYKNALKLFQNFQKFDIVLIDPPYAGGYYENALFELVQNGVLAENAIVVLESQQELQPGVGRIERYKTKKLGSTYLTYCRYTGEGE